MERFDERTTASFNAPTNYANIDQPETRVKRRKFLWLLPPVRRFCCVLPLRTSVFLFGGLFFVGAFVNVFFPFLQEQRQLIFLSLTVLFGDSTLVKWLDFTWWIFTSCASVYGGFRPFNRPRRVCLWYCCSIQLFSGIFKAVLGLYSLIRIFVLVGQGSNKNLQIILCETSLLLFLGSVISFHPAHVYWSFRAANSPTSVAPSAPAVSPNDPKADLLGKPRRSFASTQAA
eukprot:GHVS01086416.1.p1 GENE.GHVS01086416.1~~GHVS01086416.1.p1  ORF type:complete len:230 (+),score=7.40 GHVS01086416.1:213-902(+)